MSKKFKDEATNPFDTNERISFEAADAALYGKIEGLDTDTRKVAYPVDIHLLKADRTQPRKVIPLSIRKDWDGSADKVKDLLTRWHLSAEKECGRKIEPHKIIRGLTDGFDVDPKSEPITDKYIQLLSLASGIRAEGLLNPIQIHQIGKGGLIIAGERRWLAHHILSLYDDDVEKWLMIHTQDMKPNVWKQAQENGNRSPLNAIEMARQLALLIMDMYEGDDGVNFDSYETIVGQGTVDRRFYAQVADGQLYRIKRGFGDKILEATGLKSRNQVNRYRDLLNLDGKSWQLADDENWTEGRCRRILHPEQFEKPESDTSTTVDINDSYMLPIGNISPDEPIIEKTSETPNLSVGEGYSQSWHDKQNEPWQPETIEPAQSKMDDQWKSAREQAKSSAPDRLTPSEARAIAQGKIYNGPDDRKFPPGEESKSPVTLPQPQQQHETDFDELTRVNLPKSDNSNQVAFIALRPGLRRLINNIELLGRNMDMLEDCQKLKRITLWTPETIRKHMAQGGQEAVQKEVAIVEGAIMNIWERFRDEWTELLLDVEDIADQKH